MNDSAEDLLSATQPHLKHPRDLASRTRVFSAVEGSMEKDVETMSNFWMQMQRFRPFPKVESRKVRIAGKEYQCIIKPSGRGAGELWWKKLSQGAGGAWVKDLGEWR